MVKAIASMSTNDGVKNLIGICVRRLLVVVATVMAVRHPNASAALLDPETYAAVAMLLTSVLWSVYQKAEAHWSLERAADEEAGASVAQIKSDTKETETWVKLLALFTSTR